MRKLRVFCNDPEATDSSSDEDYGRSREKPEKKKKCFMREITFPSGKEEAPPQEPPVLPPSTAVKYKGVRQRKWGKFASEIRHPINKARIWLGTFNTAEEAYQVYYMKKLEFDALRNLNKSSSSDMKSNDLAKVSVDDDLGVSENLNLGKSDNLVKLNVSDELGKSDDLGNLNVNDGGGKSDNLGNLKVNDDGGKSDNMGNLNVNDDLGKYDDMGNLNVKDDDVGKFHVLDSLNVDDDLGKSDNLGNSNVKDDDVGKFHVMDSLNVHDELGKFDDVGDLNGEDCGLKTGKIGGKEEEVVGEPFGVKRAKSGKWTARVTNPRTRERIWLGTFDSVEEAVRIYKKKESEFEGSCNKKGKERLSEEPCEWEAFGVEESKRRRFCSIVRDLGDGRWEGRVWHPKLKTCVLVGTYDSHKKAEIAAKLKKAQFQKRFRSKNAWVSKRDQDRRWECGLSNDWAGYEDREMVIGLAAPKLPNEGEALIERAKNSDSIKAMDDGTSGFGSLPAGVRMTKTGRFGAWVTNPVSGTEHCVRSYKTLEDAVKTVNKFFNSKKRARCPEIISTPKNKECRVSYGSPTSVLDAEVDNSTAVSVELTNEVDVAPVKLEHGLVHGLPTPISEAERVNSEDVSVDKTRADDMTISENKQNLAPSSIFDEAVRLGIMNEYGQLLGEYSKYDEPMWLSNDEEEEDAT